ncbi:MAG: zinc ribbon domain-containing protein [Candidatus Pacebacteria bacterium]|nr:zinc ribbon domain-containing protein [Candidatus Paceibacterota bacterium]
MFCEKCGNRLEVNSKFCTKCGFLAQGGRVADDAQSNSVQSKPLRHIIFRYIYPKVKQNKTWHRLVTVLGWIMSVITLVFFPITFVIYFAIIQRVVYFVAYGDEKNKWLINE